MGDERSAVLPVHARLRDGAGVDGIFRFTPDGLSERGLAVVEIGRDEVKVVGDPPRSFGTPGTN